MRMRSLAGVALMFAALALACPGANAAPPQLAFRIDEGNNINSFVRAGPVAAHLLLRSGARPRILVAFPAGNSGVGLWFDDTRQPVTWTLSAPPKPITVMDARRRPLHGIEFEITTQARELRPRAAVLSSIRVLRDFELLGDAPDEVMVAPKSDNGVSWARDRLDGAAGYRLVVTARAGARVSATRMLAAPGSPLRLRIQALTGETPLTPLPMLLTPDAANDTRARNAFAFLSYREKFLAGSWRFDTYFGRDTLVSALLLAPVLEPQAVESAIASVLDRLAPTGEVAHEEDIGEFAVLRNLREGRGRIATPIYDYGMVDDDFMLAPLAARWLLEDARGRARASEFLAIKGAGGLPHGTALARNLVWLVERADSFADTPRAANLVGIKSGRMTGNWRDSETGLGGGRYAYDVNAALVPAALDAAARLGESGLIDAWLTDIQRSTLARAVSRARVWAKNAPALFAVDVSRVQAGVTIAEYAREVGVDSRAALEAFGDSPLRFHALSLDERGTPIPILNSDEGFRLLLTDPTPEELDRCLVAILRPFPAGLVTGVGIVVANPALAGAELRRSFGRNAYHGTVVWSWQQALLAAGIDRQLKRADLPEESRLLLTRARNTVWDAIERSNELRTSELWSWSYSNGGYRIEPFGRSGADADESNAAQLWSTVFLGIGPKQAFGADPHPPR
jgi:hypothetical protein